MARIELSNIGGGGGTTLSLTTTGTSGAATLAGSVLNIPVYQGQLTLTTTGTSGAATLSGDILNIPQYSGGGTPAGSTGEIQYNNAGAFGASANLAWDNANVRLNVGAPSAPTARLNVRGGGATSGTSTQIWTNSGNAELMRIRDDGNVGIGTSTPATKLNVVINDNSYQNAIIARNISTGTESFSGIALANSAGTVVAGFQFVPANFVNAALANTVLFTSTSTSKLGFVANSGSFVNPQDIYFSTAGGNSTYQMQIKGNGNIQINTNTDSGYRFDVISGSSTSGVRFRAPNASGGTTAFLVQNTTVSDLYKIEANGKISYLATNTAAGTTGPQTIDRPSGTVNFGIGAGSLVVTNSLCTTSSIVFATVRTNDATAYIKNVVPAAGSFTINLGAAATAETSVGFFIIN